MNLINQARSYTFRNQVPGISDDLANTPNGPYNTATENGVYAQDQWTIRKMTLNLGLRYTVYNAFVPASHLPAGPFEPARDFPAVEHSPQWKNLSPRLGVAYDLFGNGKTALKVSLGRYSVRNMGVAVNIPVSNQATSTTRTLERHQRELRPRLRSPRIRPPTASAGRGTTSPSAGTGGNTR